jgi:hypothetical protein
VGGARGVASCVIDEGYGKTESVAAGPGGGTLLVPGPFGITIDAATVPEFRGKAR